MTHVRVILPGYNVKALNMDMLKPFVCTELTLSIAYVNLPVDAVRHEFDMALLAPGLIEQAIQAEKENASAIVIDLMAEIALAAIREAVSIPVVSLPEVTMHVAAMMGRKFAIINTTEELTAIQENLARVHGFSDHLACVQGVQLNPHDDYTAEEIIQNLIEQCYDAVIEKHADTLIFGSGRLIAYRDKINEGLLKKGVNVSIIEPLPTGIYFAKFLADAKITHSKKIYCTPSADTFKKYAKILKAFNDSSI
ncbi:hydantoin racemase [Legionella busanensis]|uniref:Hydantoin racemase n=1 Tax=Legionella busanensis TaxID=190655 RepID=A0A378JRC0_9GAMM|nr:aspartate/glutamate racemase family protein [Legionella busanensis]STX52440.1 hydantoin racemase [Legionella busanensis]